LPLLLHNYRHIQKFVINTGYIQISGISEFLYDSRPASRYFIDQINI